MNFKQEISKLDLPTDSYIVVGSGILGALGIRESNDIDMIVSQVVFDSLQDEAGWENDAWPDQTVLKKDDFDLGTHWMGETVDQLIGDATVIDSVPYLSLQSLLAWKKQRGRPKDVIDVQLIETYLSEHVV